jgi:hypothetical protein
MSRCIVIITNNLCGFDNIRLPSAVYALSLRSGSLPPPLGLQLGLVPGRTLAGSWLPHYCSLHGALVPSFMLLRTPPRTSCLDQAQPPFAISRKTGASDRI